MPTDDREDLGIVIAHVGLRIGQHDKLGKIDPILGMKTILTGHEEDWEEESGTTDLAPDIAIAICKDAGARLIEEDENEVLDSRRIFTSKTNSMEPRLTPQN